MRTIKNWAVILRGRSDDMGRRAEVVIAVADGGGSRCRAEFFRVTDGRKSPLNRWLGYADESVLTHMLSPLAVEPAVLELTPFEVETLWRGKFCESLMTRLRRAADAAEPALAQVTVRDQYDEEASKDEQVLPDRKRPTRVMAPVIVRQPEPEPGRHYVMDSGAVMVVNRVDEDRVRVNVHYSDGGSPQPATVSRESFPGLVNDPAVRAPREPIAMVPEPAPEPPVRPEPERKAFVLPKSYADSYVHRDIYGVEDFKAFDHAASNRWSIFLHGPTGSAKTTAAKAYAASRGLPIGQVSGTATMEESRLFGRWVIENGSMVWVNGVVTELALYGGVLINDEINMLPPNITSTLFPLLRERVLTLHDKNGETIEAHPDLVIFGTANIGYAGTREMNLGLGNRFGLQIEWGYDDRVEKALGIVGSVRDVAGRLRASEAKGEVTVPCPTNALLEFQTSAQALGLDFAVGAFVARYHDDLERRAVRGVFDAVRSNIESDLRLS